MGRYSGCVTDRGPRPSLAPANRRGRACCLFSGTSKLPPGRCLCAISGNGVSAGWCISETDSRRLLFVSRSSVGSDNAGNESFDAVEWIWSLFEYIDIFFNLVIHPFPTQRQSYWSTKNLDRYKLCWTIEIIILKYDEWGYKKFWYSNKLEYPIWLFWYLINYSQICI